MIFCAFKILTVQPQKRGTSGDSKPWHLNTIQWFSGAVGFFGHFSVLDQRWSPKSWIFTNVFFNPEALLLLEVEKKHSNNENNATRSHHLGFWKHQLPKTRLFFQSTKWRWFRDFQDDTSRPIPIPGGNYGSCCSSTWRGQTTKKTGWGVWEIPVDGGEK